MAKWEVMSRLGPIEALWWRYMPGVEIEVPWPTGNIVVDHNDPRWVDWGGAVQVDLGFSADPNDHYRPWLEQHVGQQGWDWNWRLGKLGVLNEQTTLIIKFRRRREKHATVAAILWS